MCCKFQGESGQTEAIRWELRLLVCGHDVNGTCVIGLKGDLWVVVRVW